MIHFDRFSFLVLIPLLLCGCSRKDFAERHHNYTLGASLCVPDSWKRVPLDPAEDLVSMAFEDGRGGVVILAQSPAESFEKQVEFTSQINYPVLDRGPLLFTRYKTQWFLSDKDRTANITYVIKGKAGRIFSLICASPSLEFVTYRSLFEKIAKSFVSY